MIGRLILILFFAVGAFLWGYIWGYNRGYKSGYDKLLKGLALRIEMMKKLRMKTAEPFPEFSGEKDDCNQG